MNAIVTADWHLYDMPGFPGHIDQICQAVEAAAQKGKTLGATEFFILGDIFHNPRPTNKERKVYACLLSMLRSLNYAVYLFPGNHDISPREVCDSHNALAETTVLSPRGVTVCSFGHTFLLGNTKIVCLPHSNDAVEKGLTASAITVISAVADVFPTAENKMIMGHYPIVDALPLMVDPTDPDNVRRCLLPEFFDSPAVQRYSNVFLGDIHKAGKFKTNKATVEYPGSLVRTRFDELGHEKQFLHITDESGIVARAYPLTGIQMVELTFTPEDGLSIKATGAEDKAIKCTLSDLASVLETLDNIEGSILKLTYSGPGKELAQVSPTELAGILMRKKPAHIFRISSVNTDTSAARDLKFSSALSPKDAFIEWKSQQNYSDAAFSDKVEKAGLELLNGLN